MRALHHRRPVPLPGQGAVSAGSALATGRQAEPALAADAVATALAAAGLTQASGVFLFLSPDFARHAQPAVLAAARAAGCLNIFGMVAYGLMTEAGWSLDQPAAAALVVGGGIALAADNGGAPRLALAAGTTLPPPWQDGPPRYGLAHGPGAVWQQARVAADGRAETGVGGARCHPLLSTGLQPLGTPQAVEAAQGYDLQRLGGQRAADSLARALPPELRERQPPSLHQVCALRASGGPAIPLLAAHPDGSLTLAEPLTEGDRVAWAIRQPLGAERDMAEGLDAATAMPAFALMFSCLGRGPLFYGDEDRDLLAFRRRFPGVPLAGAYGSGQIHPWAGANRQFQNSVVTLLFEEENVQPQP